VRRFRQHPAEGTPEVEELLLAAPYRDRNAIGRMFCRLKDFRRIATRYDRPVYKLPRSGLHRKPSVTGYES